MKTYAVHELFYSLQGEGHHSGRPAVFCRFAGCNLWSGVEADRPSATCRFCDTEFVGIGGTHGGRYDGVSLARAIAGLWDSPHRPRFVVLTGGEPMLQVDTWLIDVLHRWEFEVAIETNGTAAVPASIDWITVSPKAGASLVQKSGHEIKIVYPQAGAEPERFGDFRAAYRFLQPMDGPDREANTQAAIAYCLAHPEWRLSLQTHKLLGLR